MENEAFLIRKVLCYTHEIKYNSLNRISIGFIHNGIVFFSIKANMSHEWAYVDADTWHVL